MTYARPSLCFTAAPPLQLQSRSVTLTPSPSLCGRRRHVADARLVTNPVQMTAREGSEAGGEAGLSRRAFLTSMMATAGVLLVPEMGENNGAALADGITSQLSVYRDLPKGFTILRPNGWNEFEALQDNYDIKWQDVIQPLEFVTVLTNPVSKEKALSDLGTATAVGERLAKSRNASLISADERFIDGIPAYVVELQRDQAHQITLLCVNKMKLYSVNASAPEGRWSKREKLLRAVVNSFKPKL